MSCWQECLLLNSATSGCVCSGFDFCLDPNFLTQPTVSCCALGFPFLIFFRFLSHFPSSTPAIPFNQLDKSRKGHPSTKKKIRRFRRVVISRRSIGSTASTSIRMATLGESSTKQCEIPTKMLILCLQLDFDFESNDNRVNCNFRSLNQRSPYCCFTFDQRI